MSEVGKDEFVTTLKRDPSKAILNAGRSLVGKIWSDKEFKREFVKDNFDRAWCTRGSLIVTKEGFNLFIFKFLSKSEKESF